MLNKGLSVITSIFGHEYKDTGKDAEIRYQCDRCKSLGKRFDDYKLYVNYKKMLYWCHRCEKKGRIDFSGAGRDYLADIDVIDVIDDYLSNDNQHGEGKKEDSSVSYVVPPYYPEQGEVSHNYLLSRGLTNGDIRFYDIRVSGVFDKDNYGRVIVPNRVWGGVLTDMYVARNYLNDYKKYKNPRGSASNSTVFNLHRIPDNPDYLIICEGVFSAMAVDRNAVATYGKNFSEKQLTSIIEKNPKIVYVSYDPDAMHKAEELCEYLSRRFDSTKEVRLVELPDDLDPADVGRERFRDYLEDAYLYKDSVSYIIDGMLKKQ